LGARVAGARIGPRAAHHRPVAAALEPRPVVEARLFEYRAPVAGGDPAAPRGVRPAEGNREDCPRRARRSALISIVIPERARALAHEPGTRRGRPAQHEYRPTLRFPKV